MALVREDEKYQTGEPPVAEGHSADVIVSPDTRRDNRIPPGQARTRKWPVLQADIIPIVDKDKWTLTVNGLVERPFTINWQQFLALPRVKVFADFHCVTKWSRLGNLWEGVSTKTIADMAGIKPEAQFVIAGGYDPVGQNRDWTTNLPLEHFMAQDALLVDLHDGQPLSADHGAPVRLMIPALYAWKSAKWLKTLTFSATNDKGYWEQAGYHDLGDPWREQRFQDDENIPPGFYE